MASCLSFGLVARLDVLVGGNCQPEHVDQQLDQSWTAFPCCNRPTVVVTTLRTRNVPMILFFDKRLFNSRIFSLPFYSWRGGLYCKT